MSCRLCGDKKIYDYANNQCKFCYQLYFKNEVIHEREPREKKKKEKPPKYLLKCEVCLKYFHPIKNNPRQRFCSTKCRPKEKTNAEKWLDKKLYKHNGLNSDQVAYGFFRKKYTVKARFNACRG